MAAARWLFPPPGGPSRANWALAQPDVAGGERGHLRLGDHPHGFEVEAVGVFPDGSAPRRDDARCGVGRVRRVRFGDGDEEASGRSSSLVGRSANCGHTVLMAGSRSSLTGGKARRIAAWAYSCGVSHHGRSDGLAKASSGTRRTSTCGTRPGSGAKLNAQERQAGSRLAFSWRRALGEVGLATTPHARMTARAKEPGIPRLVETCIATSLTSLLHHERSTV